MSREGKEQTYKRTPSKTIFLYSYTVSSTTLLARCPGIASVFSGTAPAAAAAAAPGGYSLGAGPGGGVGFGVEVGALSGLLRRGSLLSGERAVFKPVVDRIESLELQVRTSQLVSPW